MNKKFATFLATFGLIGFFPFAPGTLASLMTVLLVWLTSLLTGPIGGWSILVAALGIYLVGIPASTITEKELSRKDPRPVVIDEVAGQLVALAFLPLTWQTMLMAFLLFRVFDIIKPFPINWLDKNLPGGFGIMSDDMLAGAFALGVGHLILRFVL